MPGVDDQAAVARWLSARLLANTAVAALIGTRLYPEQAPQDQSGNPATGYPFLKFSFNSARVMLVSGGRQRALSDQYVAISATVQGEDYDAAVAVMQAVDASLTAADAEGTVSVGGVNHYVTVAGMDHPFRMPEFDRGRHYRTSGAVYWIQVHDR